MSYYIQLKDTKITHWFARNYFLYSLLLTSVCGLQNTSGLYYEEEGEVFCIPKIQLIV